MRVYFGSRGNRYYIMCRDFDECYAFNTFGTLESKEGLISDCNNWGEVDVLSFVSSNTNSCEMLFNDEKVMLNKSLFDCTSAVRKGMKYLGTMFTITHEDEVGKFTQVLFVFSKGIITKSMLNLRFLASGWNNLK